MFTRSVTKMGLVNIGRHLRGDVLDGEVILYLAEDCIRVEPYYPEQNYRTTRSVITKFDQYNRLHIPQGMQRAAHIKKRVEITIEGCVLTIAPAAGEE